MQSKTKLSKCAKSELVSNQHQTPFKNHCILWILGAGKTLQTLKCNLRQIINQLCHLVHSAEVRLHQCFSLCKRNCVFGAQAAPCLDKWCALLTDDQLHGWFLYCISVISHLCCFHLSPTSVKLMHLLVLFVVQNGLMIEACLLHPSYLLMSVLDR